MGAVGMSQWGRGWRGQWGQVEGNLTPPTALLSEDKSD